MAERVLDDFDTVHAASREVARQLVLSDIRLRGLSLEHVQSWTSGRSILATSSARAALRFTLRRSAERGWLFGLWSSKEADVVADLRVRLGLRPEIAQPEPASEQPRLRYVTPPFLGVSSRGAPRFRTAAGRTLFLRRRSGGVELRTAPGGPTLLASGWPFELLLDVLETLGRWRAGAEGAELPLRPDEDTVLGELLARVAAAQAGLAAELAELGRSRSTLTLLGLRQDERDLLRGAAALRRASPDLVPRYGLDELETRALLRWNRRGQLLGEADGEAWLHLDATLAHDAADARPTERVSLRPTDVLVPASPYFDVFLDALRDRAREELVERIAERMDLHPEAVHGFLDGLEPGRVVLARIDRDDRDLVLLPGRAGERVLLLVTYEVEPYPAVGAKVRRIEVLGGRVGTAVREGPVTEREVARHLSRLLVVLLRFQAWCGEEGP